MTLLRGDDSTRTVRQPIDSLGAADETRIKLCYRDTIAIRQRSPMFPDEQVVYLDCEEALLATMQACLEALGAIRAKSAKESTT